MLYWIYQFRMTKQRLSELNDIKMAFAERYACLPSDVDLTPCICPHCKSMTISGFLECGNSGDTIECSECGKYSKVE